MIEFLLGLLTTIGFVAALVLLGRWSDRRYDAEMEQLRREMESFPEDVRVQMWGAYFRCEADRDRL